MQSTTKPTFDEYIFITEEETQNYKQPLCNCLQINRFFKTFHILDQYFEKYACVDSSKLHSLVYSHCKCLYALLLEEKMIEGSHGDNDQQQISSPTQQSSSSSSSVSSSLMQDQANLERMKQMLTFMYRVDVECESTAETLEKLRGEQDNTNSLSGDEMFQFILENAAVFDRERNKFKQVLLDTIQYYTVQNRSKNYRFDFEILLGFYRLVFESHNYFAPSRSDPGKAAQDALGETDLYAELIEECGLCNG